MFSKNNNVIAAAVVMLAPGTLGKQERTHSLRRRLQWSEDSGRLLPGRTQRYRRQNDFGHYGRTSRCYAPLSTELQYPAVPAVGSENGSRSRLRSEKQSTGTYNFQSYADYGNPSPGRYDPCPRYDSYPRCDTSYTTYSRGHYGSSTDERSTLRPANDQAIQPNMQNGHQPEDDASKSKKLTNFDLGLQCASAITGVCMIAPLAYLIESLIHKGGSVASNAAYVYVFFAFFLAFAGIAVWRWSRSHTVVPDVGIGAGFLGTFFLTVGIYDVTHVVDAMGFQSGPIFVVVGAVCLIFFMSLGQRYVHMWKTCLRFR